MALRALKPGLSKSGLVPPLGPNAATKFGCIAHEIQKWTLELPNRARARVYFVLEDSTRHQITTKSYCMVTGYFFRGKTQPIAPKRVVASLH